MRARTVAKLIGIAILIFVVLIAASTSTYVVQPGTRGVEVTLGKVAPVFKPEGFGFKTPFITTVVPVTIKQQTRDVQSACYSADLQQVNMDLRVLYRVPEASVVQIYQNYAGDPFDSLVAPRVQEAMKEVTAMQSAEQIVKNREEIKAKALAAAREKVGTLLHIEDVVIQNIDLTKELEDAIEAKMVQEQEAAKAKFTQQKAQIEADTAVIKAKGDAESIRLRGDALKENPNFIDLQIVEKWDGKSPLVVGGGSSGGANILLPLNDLQKQRVQP
ncbi:MAG TPA: prohibitin family protein [Verrucomicrobiae bacterium]|nr:prohibitin family protein [Verrucomicrobiae bacterium]